LSSFRYANLQQTTYVIDFTSYSGVGFNPTWRISMKRFALTLMTVAALGLLAVGCAKKQDDSQSGEQPAANEALEMTKGVADDNGMAAEGVPPAAEPNGADPAAAGQPGAAPEGEEAAGAGAGAAEAPH
jgi:hypothetical protein